MGSLGRDTFRIDCRIGGGNHTLLYACCILWANSVAKCVNNTENSKLCMLLSRVIGLSVFVSSACSTFRWNSATADQWRSVWMCSDLWAILQSVMHDHWWMNKQKLRKIKIILLIIKWPKAFHDHPCNILRELYQTNKAIWIWSHRTGGHFVHVNYCENTLHVSHWQWSLRVLITAGLTVFMFTLKNTFFHWETKQ